VWASEHTCGCWRAAAPAKKKSRRPLLAEFERLWSGSRAGFKQGRNWLRGQRLALSLLVCLGRHTITGMLSAAGRQFCDWSADYRLFAAARVAPEALFAVLRRAGFAPADRVAVRGNRPSAGRAGPTW